MAVHFILIFMIISLTACQKDLPKPETKGMLWPTKSAQIAHASDFATQYKEPFQVQYYLKGNNVLIECMISNFSFRNNHENSKLQTGIMHVYVDGKKVKEVSSAAFIIKDLHRGNHRVSLQIIKHNGEKTSLKKELIITIP